MLRLERVQHKALRKISFFDAEPISRFSNDYSRVSLKHKIPSLSSLFDSIDSIYVYKIMSNNSTDCPLRKSLPLNTLFYPTRYFQPLYPPVPKNVFATKDPIFRLCKLGNIIALHKPLLIAWNITNNVASNLINSFTLNFC